MSEGVVKRGKTWSFFIELPRDPVTGERDKKKWESGYRTQQEARTERAKRLAAVSGGTYVPKTRQTVGEFVDEWLAAIKPTVRESTHYSYSRNLKLHVVPVIGSAPLAAIDGGTLNQLYAALLADGRKDYAGGGLSPRTVRYIHTIIHRAFKDAVRWGRLARNPADAAAAQGRRGEPPGVDHLDRRPAPHLPRGHAKQSALDCLLGAGHNRIATRRSVGIALV
jgi:Phage integrase, N-terminal SAM-like domain